MCKQIVTPAYSEPRNCKHKEYQDGYCKIHHPDTIEENLMRELQHEQRRIERIEESVVGAWMRNKYPDLFIKMLEEKRAWPE